MKPLINAQKEATPKKRILVAPLDWGLGHATRCIPVIQELIKNNCEVIIGAEGKIKLLLQSEFPELTFLSLPGYHIRYSRYKWQMAAKIFFQIPSILKTIKAENSWLNDIVKEYGINAVISDNRYGLYHPQIFSVFITHQLTIKSSLGNGIEKIVQRLNYSFINRFNECWVPDMQGSENLAGALSHPIATPKIPLQYTGILTRFKKEKSKPAEKHLLVLLSGPEPQRSILENLLLPQLETYQKPVLFIRGLPEGGTILNAGNHITIKNHLPASQLQQAIEQAFFIISRCGYSTIMDIAELNKKSILIPTPGQTEQEYLAKHIMQQQYAVCLPQCRFNLQKALHMAANFPYRPFVPGNKTLLADAIKPLVLYLNA